MCSVCSSILFMCLGPLPKPFRKKKKVLPDKCREVAAVGILKCDLVWRTLRVYWCSFLGCVNLIQFYLHALTINTAISLVTSRSLLFFSIQQPLISRPCFWLYVTEFQQVAALPRYFGVWRVGKAPHRKWLLLQNSSQQFRSSHPYHACDLPLGENNVPKSPFYICFILSWCLLSYSTVK